MDKERQRIGKQFQRIKNKDEEKANHIQKIIMMKVNDYYHAIM